MLLYDILAMPHHPCPSRVKSHRFRPSLQRDFKMRRRYHDASQSVVIPLFKAKSRLAPGRRSNFGQRGRRLYGWRPHFTVWKRRLSRLRPDFTVGERRLSRRLRPDFTVGELLAYFQGELRQIAQQSAEGNFIGEIDHPSVWEARRGRSNRNIRICTISPQFTRQRVGLLRRITNRRWGV